MTVILIPADQDPRRTLCTLNPSATIPPPPKTLEHYPDLPSKHGILAHFPLEIREMIIEEAMRAGGHFNTRFDAKGELIRSKDGVRPTCLPAICHTNKTMYEEATPVFLRNTTWVVRSGEANKFLMRAEIYLVSLIPGLAVYPQNLDLTLMARCTGLKQVLFTIHLSRLATPLDQENDSEFLFQVKTVEEIVSFYGFEEVFKCKDLKSVVFDAITYWEYEDDCDGSPGARLQDLANWIRGGFDKKLKKEVSVEVAWRSFKYG